MCSVQSFSSQPSCIYRWPIPTVGRWSIWGGSTVVEKLLSYTRPWVWTQEQNPSQAFLSYLTICAPQDTTCRGKPSLSGPISWLANCVLLVSDIYTGIWFGWVHAFKFFNQLLKWSLIFLLTWILFYQNNEISFTGRQGGSVDKGPQPCKWGGLSLIPRTQRQKERMGFISCLLTPSFTHAHLSTWAPPSTSGAHARSRVRTHTYTIIIIFHNLKVTY